MTALFISYRRETAAGEARALSNDLVARLGKGSVFMDVDSIALGRDFRSVLQKTLESCEVMLVVIDKDWAEIKDEEGRPRLEDPKDFVRMEVGAALKRDIVVTPILVGGAQMPAAEQLPADIKDLAYRNGFELAHNRWESDVQEMIRRLGLDSPKGKPIESSPPIAQGKAANRLGWGQFKQPIILVVAAVLVIAVPGLGLLWLNNYQIAEPTGEQRSTFNAPVPGTDNQAASDSNVVLMLDRLSREIERGCIPFQLGHIATNLPNGLQTKVDQRLEQIRVNAAPGQKVKIVLATQLSYDPGYSLRLAELNGTSIKNDLVRRGLNAAQVETVTVLPANEQPLEFPRLGNFDCLAYVRQ